MDTIISHYVRIDIKEGNTLEVWLVEETFDLAEYVKAQLKWAMECPYNRNGVREKMMWNDEDLKHNPGVLLKHFIEQHGDAWFRDNLRPKFIKTKSVKLEDVDKECFLAQVNQFCKKCAVCKIAKFSPVQS